MESLIAIRKKGFGDTWKSCWTPEDYKQFDSLTECLESYYQDTQNKCDFRLSPSKGELYAILESEDQPKTVKKFNIYDEQ